MSAGGRPGLVALSVADPPERWAALGFPVDGAVMELGGVRIELGAAGEGIVGWELSGIPAGVDDIDGLPTRAVEPRGAPEPDGFGVDHVVVLTPEFDRTAAAFAALGMEYRRVRQVGEGEQGFRQGFRRLGPAILEVVERRELPPGPCTFWGLTLIVHDIDGFAAALAPGLIGSVRPAVQNGRRIATLRRAAGLSMPVAVMDPEP